MMGDRKRQNILIAGVPPIFPKIEISSLVEELGGIVVFDASLSGYRYPDDPKRKRGDNSMPRTTGGLTGHAVSGLFAPLGAADDRLMLINRIVADLSVDGVLYYVLKGWDLYDIGLHRIEKAMKEKNIPLFRIRTDYDPESFEKMRARIHAFIKMLKKSDRGK